PLLVAGVLAVLLPESPRFLARHRARWPALVTILQRAGHAVESSTEFVGPAERRGSVSIATLLKPEFRRDTLALWLAFVSCLLAVYLGFTWVPSMLTGAGLPSLASTGLSVFNLGGVFGAIVGSLIISKIGSRRTMLVMAAGAIAGALVMRSMTISAASD